MCLKMYSLSLLIVPLFIMRTTGDSDENTSASLSYPGHVNFNEIFSNSLSMLADDSLTTVTKDDDFHLNPLLASQYAEFRLSSYTTPIPTKPPTTTKMTTTPKPMYPKAKDLEETTSTESPTSPTTTTTMTTTTNATTTTSTSKEKMQSIPIKHYQRGVLDLILPASRVKNFKDFFETFRRLLSNTFKK